MDTLPTVKVPRKTVPVKSSVSEHEIRSWIVNLVSEALLNYFRIVLDVRVCILLRYSSNPYLDTPCNQHEKGITRHGRFFKDRDHDSPQQDVSSLLRSDEHHSLSVCPLNRLS